jgi:hypothetical protein
VTTLGDFSPIGRIFAYWANVCELWAAFLNYKSSPKIGPLFPWYVNVMS